MKKSYLDLSYQVDNLFNLPLNKKESIDIRLQLIEALIVSSGWDINEYFLYVSSN
jgi:hypothetical protein